MTIKIRRTEDLQAIHELDRQTFPGDPPTLDKDKTHIWWIAEADDLFGPVAFIGLSTGFKFASITRVGVIKEARGAGLQKRLVRVALRHARQQGYEIVATYVLATNIPSLRSLLACGFKPFRSQESLGRLFLEMECRLT